MLFSNIIGELTGSVGNGLANQSSDIKKVKDGLSNLGLFKDNEIEDQDFITRDLDEGIKSFQRDKKLKVDGRLFPRGETERELFSSVIVERKPEFKAKPKQKPQTNPLLNLVEQIIKPKSVAQSDVIAGLKSQQSLVNEGVPMPSRKTATFDEDIIPVDVTGRIIRKRKHDKTKSHELKRAEERAIIRMQKWEGDPDRKSSKQLFNHYLKGSGKTVTLRKDQIIKSQTFRKAMEKNQKRFEASIVNGQVDGINHEFKNQILSIKDGETVVLKKSGRSDGNSDEWHRDVGSFEGAIRDRDQFLSTGSVKVKSTGGFTVTREGSKITIEGTIEHSVNDRYNFNKGSAVDIWSRGDYRRLEEEGSAKSFDVKGKVIKDVKATMTINNDEIIDANFEYKDQDKKQ